MRLVPLVNSFIQDLTKVFNKKTGSKKSTESGSGSQISDPDRQLFSNE